MKVIIKTKANLLDHSFLESDKEYTIDLDKNCCGFPLKLEEISIQLDFTEGLFFLEKDWSILSAIIFCKETSFHIYDNFKRNELKEALINVDHIFNGTRLTISYSCGDLEDAKIFESKVMSKVLLGVHSSSEIVEQTNTEDQDYPYTSVSFSFIDYTSIHNLKDLIPLIDTI